MYLWEQYSPENRYAIAPHDTVVTEAYRPPDSGAEIQVNAAFRFSGIFTADIGQAVQDGAVSGVLVNAALHFLAHLDLLSAVTPDALERDILSMEIQAGAYGGEIRERFLCLDSADRERLLRWLQAARREDRQAWNETDSFFARVFLDFFGRLQNTLHPRPRWDGGYTPCSAEIYYNRPADVYYCYCAAEGNAYNRGCFALLRLLFADWDRDIRPVWGKRCFGILGETHPDAAAVPLIGEIQIL